MIDLSQRYGIFKRTHCIIQMGYYNFEVQVRKFMSII